MNLSLNGRHAVVCGSSQGIGLAIAKELALLGARCTLLARNATSLEAAISTLDRSSGQSHAFSVADFSDTAAVENAIAAIVAKGPVHILVNNTGGPPGGPITEAAGKDFMTAFSQHVICNHILATAVIPSMRSEGYGRIINIISTSVKVPLKNLGVSNTVRGATASWAKTMANELGAFNITVNNILPGATRTARLSAILDNTAQRANRPATEIEADMQKEIPARRFGTPEEIAAMAAFLATPAAAYVNGTSIPVDGGRTGSI